MPIPSPVHASIAQRCSSMFWKDWAGYYAVRSFDTCHEREYFALRHSVGIIDVSPLFKYEVKGNDAGTFLSRIMSKNVRELAVGQVTYLCWCDDDGYVLDDGTVSRLDDGHYRVTAAEPSFAWFSQFTGNFDVSIEDSSATLAALSIQGPLSRAALTQAVEFDLSQLKFFRVTPTKICGVRGWISRTGYTGDLGYEVWVPASHAIQVYEGILLSGQAYGIKPCGLDAMDITRIEAGFIMNGVDYISANHCLTENRKDTPFEIGLGNCVQLERDPFIGQRSLQAKKDRPRRCFVGFDIDWLELEAEFAKHDLPPEVSSAAWRDGKPVYNAEGEFIGQATSGAWSPTLKRNLALGQVQPAYANDGTEVRFEITVEFQRIPIKATVCRPPFYNPAHKRN